MKTAIFIFGALTVSCALLGEMYRAADRAGVSLGEWMAIRSRPALKLLQQLWAKVRPACGWLLQVYRAHASTFCKLGTSLLVLYSVVAPFVTSPTRPYLQHRVATFAICLLWFTAASGCHWHFWGSRSKQVQKGLERTLIIGCVVICLATFVWLRIFEHSDKTNRRAAITYWKKLKREGLRDESPEVAHRAHLKAVATKFDVPIDWLEEAVKTIVVQDHRVDTARASVGYREARDLAVKLAHDEEKKRSVPSIEEVHLWIDASEAEKQFDDTKSALKYAAKAVVDDMRTFNFDVWAGAKRNHAVALKNRSAELKGEAKKSKSAELEKESAQLIELGLAVCDELIRAYTQAGMSDLTDTQKMLERTKNLLKAKMVRGDILAEKMDHKTAEGIFREVARRHTELRGDRELGPEDKDYFKAESAAANCLACQNKHEAAEKKHREILSHCEKIYGPQDQFTLAVCFNLAWSLEKQPSKLLEALKYARKTYDGRHDGVDPDARGTREAKEMVDRLSKAVGDRVSVLVH